MNNALGRGIVAGFIATIVLSAFMILKAMLGMLPAMNAIGMLTGMSHQILGTPATPLVGWVIHFLIGTVLWGVLFGWLHEHIPGNGNVARGLVFATGAWVLMMILVMPMAGAGFFGLGIGIGAPAATLVLHWIYGAVLGLVFDRLGRRGTFAAGT